MKGRANEILRWLAGKALDREPLPEDVPSVEEFTEWTVRGAPNTAAAEAQEKAQAEGIGPTVWTAMHVLPDMAIVSAHEQWKEQSGDANAHPFVPLMRAWQDRQIRTGREFCPTQKASLARFHNIEEAHLMDMPPPLHDDTPAQPWLPYLDPNLAPSPSWLLWLYDQCGGRDITGKRGAHWSFRLFIYAFLHLHVQDRDGRWRSRAFPQEQVIGWLHPSGWGNRRRDFDKFPAALQQINRDLSILPVGKGWLNIIGTSYSPKHEAVEFNLRLPSAAAHGASVDWPALLHSGTISDVRFRSHLSAAAFLDRSARAGHGITAEIGKAFRDDTGNPKRRRGGSIIRSATELEANPAAAFVRPLTDRQLTAMIGLDPSNRKHRLRTKGAFRGLHADGVIDLRDERGGARIFQPAKRVIAER